MFKFYSRVQTKWRYKMLIVAFSKSCFLRYRTVNDCLGSVHYQGVSNLLWIDLHLPIIKPLRSNGEDIGNIVVKTSNFVSGLQLFHERYENNLSLFTLFIKR